MPGRVQTCQQACDECEVAQLRHGERRPAPARAQVEGRHRSGRVSGRGRGAGIVPLRRGGSWWRSLPGSVPGTRRADQLRQPDGQSPQHRIDLVRPPLGPLEELRQAALSSRRGHADGPALRWSPPTRPSRSASQRPRQPGHGTAASLMSRPLTSDDDVCRPSPTARTVRADPATAHPSAPGTAPR